MTSFPALASLPAPVKRVILHWTGGGYTPSSFDLQHYHFIVDGEGFILPGIQVEANLRKLSLSSKGYAAHTKGCNSFSVGIALAGMAHAVPGGPYGKYPITEVQVESMCEFVARLTEAWKLPVTEKTVFTHWEAQHLHGIKQEFKWDITELPYDRSLKPEQVGPHLRELVKSYLASSGDSPPFSAR